MQSQQKLLIVKRWESKSLEQKNQEMDYLNFQIDDLEAHAFKKDEDSELENQKIHIKVLWATQMILLFPAM